MSLSDPGRYLTVDRFTDEGAWRTFLTGHGDAYARLDAATKGLTTDECELAGGEVGSASTAYRQVAEAWPGSPD